MCTLGLTSCLKTPHFRHLRLSWDPLGLRILTTSSPWASPNLWQDPKLPHWPGHGVLPFFGLWQDPKLPHWPGHGSYSPDATNRHTLCTCGSHWVHLASGSLLHVHSGPHQTRQIATLYAFAALAAHRLHFPVLQWLHFTHRSCIHASSHA